MARILRILWSCVFLLTALASVAFGQLRSTDDTYVTGANPSTNNGTSTSLVVQAGTSPSYTFIKPDLTPLTGVTGSQVQKAYLRIYVTAVTAAGKFDVKQVGGPWTESALTYGSGCGSTSPNNGCNLATNATTIASGVMVNYPTPNSKSQYFDIDITPTVKAWLGGDPSLNISPATNYGVVLVPSSTSSISASFASKEDTTFSHDAEILVVLNPSAAQIVGQISPLQIGPGTAGINVSGYAMTLYSTSQCLGGAYATGINTSGVAQCSTNGAALMGLNASALTNGTVPSSALSGTYGINISGTAASATTAVSANTAVSATNFTGSLLGDVTGTQSATAVSKIGGVSASNFARLDIANLFNGNQNIAGGKLTLAPSTAGYPSLNFPNTGAAPNPLHTGDLWLLNTDPHLNFRDMNNVSQLLAFTSDVTTANSATLSSANSYTDAQVAAEAATRAAADIALQNNISAEAAARQAADTTLQTNIAAETTNRQAAETVLQNNINTESAARAAADTAEALARAAADTTLQNNISAETTRAQAAEASKADLTGTNVFTGSNTFSGPKVDLSGSAATLPAQAILGPPPTGSHVCVAGQMVLQKDGAPGQQLFICNATLDGWVWVNDDTTLNTNLQGAINAEAAARQAADNTLTNNLNNEISRAQGVEATLTTNLNTEINRATSAESAESTARQAADTTLQNNINTETASRVASDTLLQSNINAEITARQAADNTLQTNINNVSAASAQLTGDNNFSGNNVFTGAGKTFDISAVGTTLPVRVDSAAAVNAVCATQNAMVLNPTQPVGQQLMTCQMVNSQLQWVLVNDEQTLSASVTAETNRAQAAEATITTNLNNEITRAQGAESTLTSNLNGEISRATAAETTLQTNINAEAATRAAADTSLGVAITSETSRATGAETTLQSNINALSAASAKLNGGNNFTGGEQNLAPSATGYASLNVPNSATAPSNPGTGDIWLFNGDPHLNFWDKNNMPQMFAFLSDVTTANSATLTSANSYTDAQVLAEKNRATGAESTLTTNLSNEISRAQGAESSLNSAITTETGRAQNAEAGLTLSIANESARAQGVEGTLTTNLSNEINRATTAENTKANLDGGNNFTGGKQALAQSANTYASLNLPNSANGPDNAHVGIGDIWLTGFDAHLQFRDKSNTTQSLAFLADVTSASSNLLAANNSWSGTNTFSNPISGSITGTASTITGNIGENQVTSLSSDLNSLNTAIAGETTRAMTAENSLSVAITNETNRATAAENAKANLDGGNTFIGGRQVLAASLQGNSGYASLNFPGTGTTPTNVQTGDVWLTSGDNHLQFQSASGVKSLAFTTDIAGGTVTGTNLTSGQLLIGAGGSAISIGNLSGEVTTSGSTATALAGTITTAHTFSNAANSFSGSGAGLTNVNAATLGGLASSAFAQLGTNDVFTGSVTASSFSGNGANLTALNAGNISTGTLADSRLSANIPLLNAANSFTNTTGNTFAGTTTLGNTTAGSGGLLIPPSASGAQKVSFPLDMEATNTGNTLHLFRIIAQDGGTPSWLFQFCNSAPCAPASNGLSIAGSTGIITFAPGQTFPGTGGGTVTSVATGAGLTGGPITSTGTISIATGGVTNAMLQNSSVTLTPGTGLSGGGAVSLGGSTTLNLANTAVTAGSYTLSNITVDAQGRITAASNGTAPVTSVFGRSGAVTAQPGDYTFAQLGAGSNTNALTIGTGGSLAPAGSGTITANALAAGTYGSVLAFSNAASTFAGTAASATNAGNASQLGGESPATAATASTIAARDASGNLTATQFNGSGAGLTSLNASNLSTGTVPAPALGNNNVRTICYVAGADNTNAPALTTSDTQKSFFNNMIGNMTVTGAKCQVDAGSVTMNVQKNNLASAVTTSVACTSTPGTWQTLSVTGSALALGDSLDLSITAASTARRLTICLSATVN